MKEKDTRKTVKLEEVVHKKVRLHVASTGEKINDFMEQAVALRLGLPVNYNFHKSKLKKQ